MITILKTILMAAVLSSVPAAGNPPTDAGTGTALQGCPASPNCVSSLAPDERHYIAPFIFAGSPDAAFNRLYEVLAARKDTRIVVIRGGYLRVEFHTLLGFVDDGEFLVDGAARVIHLRSASRIGWSDLGKNRRRAEEIRRDFSGESGAR